MAFRRPARPVAQVWRRIYRMWESTLAARKIGWRRPTIASLMGAVLLFAGCAPPIEVVRAKPVDVDQELDSNVVNTGNLSEATKNILRREDLFERFQSDPQGAIAGLHHAVATRGADPDLLYALASTSFRWATKSQKQSYFLAAAIYAYAFLFPDNPKQRPSAFDRRFRTACDIYNRGLTSAFATADHARVELRSGRRDLPFGIIDVTFDPTTARWGGQKLSDFTPADELRIDGLQARYRRAGIGASLAADATPPVVKAGFQVEPDVKVPVTALLRVDLSRNGLARGQLRGSIEVHPAFEPDQVMIEGQPVPLEADTSAAFAFSLSDPKIWKSEFAGFLDGNFFNRSAAQLVGLEPYRPGQIPVVFIHGTGSSSGRWANLINDLQSDPVIRTGFQFWSFSYATGNPTSFSAEQLRSVIEEAVHDLDPQGKDPALQKMVLIGHSQGGLSAKWVSIDSGSRLWDALSKRPPEALHLAEGNAALLRRVYFVKPLPEVRRVIFIATPQHGSFVAESPVGEFLARFVTPRGPVLDALRDLSEDNPKDLGFDPNVTRFGSVWSMSSQNPVSVELATIPVAPKIAAHSIIAVEGDGPTESGDDGIVTYQSAHIPEAVSEIVVRSSHSVQSHPLAVGEVRRILMLHLAEACPKGCLPVVAAEDSPIDPLGRGKNARLPIDRQAATR